MRRESAGADKLLCRLGDESLLQRCCRIVESAGFEPIVVVLGHRADRLRAELESFCVRAVMNPRYLDGQATSVARGVEALEGSAIDGAVFVPADQPGLDTATLNRLARAFRSSDGKTIAAPRWRERRGAPVLFASQHFEALRSLEGDSGGRQILAQHEQEIAWVELENDLPLLDADTPDALRDVAQRLGCRVDFEGIPS